MRPVKTFHNRCGAKKVLNEKERLHEPRAVRGKHKGVARPNTFNLRLSSLAGMEILRGLATYSGHLIMKLTVFALRSPSYFRLGGPLFTWPLDDLMSTYLFVCNKTEV